MGQEKKHCEEPGKLRQFLVAMVANLAALSYGMAVGWQSPVNPQLQSSNPPVGTEAMTDEESSWLSGSMCLGGTIMTLFAGIITEKFGRKITGCLVALPFTISWLMSVFATNLVHLFIARFLAGIGGSIAIFLVPLYVSEISCDSIRGMLGSLLVFILNVGILVSYVLGAVLSFRNFNICGLIVPLAYLAAFVFMPESPVYLVRRSRLREATRSLMWLKAGCKDVVEREMVYLQTQAKEAAASTRSVRCSDLFRDKATVKGLIITMALFSGQQFCGIFAMISYTETIFSISGSSLSPNTAAITVAAIQVFGSYLSTSLMEKMGRRLLILISCSGMCFCHYILGTFCYLQNHGHDIMSFNWIPVAALSIYMIMYCLGLGPGPYVVSSEIFSRDVSSLGTTIGLLSVWIVAFIVVKFYPSLIVVLGIDGCFFLLGTFCLCTFIFTWFMIPETKGRCREDIVEELNGISSKKDVKNLPSPVHV